MLQQRTCLQGLRRISKNLNAGWPFGAARQDFAPTDEPPVI